MHVCVQCGNLVWTMELTILITELLVVCVFCESVTVPPLGEDWRALDATNLNGKDLDKI